MRTKVSRIGVVGDVHTEDVRLHILLEFLAAQNTDKLYCVGDIADGKCHGDGSVDRCCQLLMEYNVPTVLGNHDQWCLNNVNRGVENATFVDTLTKESRSFLEALPMNYTLETPRGDAMLCHGLGEYNMASVYPTDSPDNIHNNLELWAIYRHTSLSFVINGHSHRPDVHLFNHLAVINAGSLHDSGIASAVIIDFQLATAEFYRVNELSLVEHCVTKKCLTSESIFENQGGHHRRE